MTNFRFQANLLVLIISFCFVSAKLARVFEENPFLNGEFQPGIIVPQGPVNDPIDTGEYAPVIDPIYVNHKPTALHRPPQPTIRPGLPIGPLLPPVKPPVVHPPPHPPVDDDLSKYCLHPRGQFQSRYCNAFVNCWEGNVVEQFCGATLVFNPKGFCDYIWNVNCHGKPIKELTPIIGGSNGWPTDGSYVPPVPSTHPPIHHPVHPPQYPPGPKPPVELPHPAQPGGPVFTIEPPGFPNNPSQDHTGVPIYHPPHDHTQVTPRPTFPTHHTTTTTWRPTIATNPTPGNADLRRFCLHPRGQFAGPHCHKFVNCWDDVVIEQDCPDGLNFNPIRHYCDFPHNYPCRKLKEGDLNGNQQDYIPQGNELEI